MDDTEKWSLDVIVVVIDVIIEVMHKHVIAKTEHNLHSIELWCQQVIVVSIVLREIDFSSFFSQTIDLPFFVIENTSLHCECNNPSNLISSLFISQQQKNDTNALKSNK